MTAIGFYFFYILSWTLSYLPLKFLYLLSDLSFPIAFYIIRYRRKVVFKNLQNSFPEKPVVELHRIERIFYRHFMDIFFETIKIPHLTENEICQRVRYNNLSLLEKYYKNGKGVITMLGHCGNWEWHVGFPLHSPHKAMAVYLPLRNRYFDKWMMKTRMKFMAELVPAADIMRKLYRYHSQAELIHCAFLADQSPQIQHTQLWINFLNQETPVFTSAEKIARKFDLPVIYMRMVREKRGYYRVDIENIMEHPKTAGENKITERFFQMLEDQIREYPEQWLWTHRRWKFTKEDWLEQSHLSD